MLSLRVPQEDLPMLPPGEERKNHSKILQNAILPMMCPEKRGLDPGLVCSSFIRA